MDHLRILLNMDSDSVVVGKGLHFKQTMKDKVLSTLSRTGMR